ncbi:MAG: alpha/beta hydrolase, partial [bacterium]
MQKLEREGGHTLAYRASPGKGPGVIFLGGFLSDMEGTKAAALEERCRAAGRAFVRFDYLGHGASSGRFEEGTIGRWAEDAVAVLDAVAEGPQVLVGSSMGGWIMLLAALARPGRVAGLVGIAAAPDFTEDLMWARFPEEVRERLRGGGTYHLPSEYDENPYPITGRLIEEGRGRLLLRGRIPIVCPVRLIHGMEDADVPSEVSLKLSEALESADVTVTLVKGG